MSTCLMKICVSDVDFTLKLKSKTAVANSDILAICGRFFRDDKTGGLQKTINAYPIGKPYKKVKKKIPVLRKENVTAEKDD